MESVFLPIVQKIIWGILAVLGAFIFGKSRGWWGKASAKRRAGRAKGTHFTILVAELDGDADKSQTRHIVASLESQLRDAEGASVHILPYPEVLAIGLGERQAAISAAEAKGRRWLEKRRADVLIWGEVGARDRVLRLRLLSPDGRGGGSKGYGLNEKLELPPDFGADLGAALAVQAAAAIEPVYERAGETLAEIISPIVAKLRPLAEKPPASFSDDDKARLWHAYAAGEYRLGEEKGDDGRLEAAIAFYRKALSVWTRKRAPLDWAAAQNHLGAVLQRLGERESGAARLEEAVAAYRQALLEWTRERAPLDWAMTQNNLGNALARLGERESGVARLEEAVAAYRQALLEWTRERTPLDWAMTQNNLGAALQSLGERESGAARLEEAVAAYRQALQERTRERAPLQWAATQNNLCNALRVLGERQAQSAKGTGCAALAEARQAMLATLEVGREAQASYDVEQSQRNLRRIDDAIAKLGC